MQYYYNSENYENLQKWEVLVVFACLFYERI